MSHAFFSIVATLILPLAATPSARPSSAPAPEPPPELVERSSVVQGFVQALHDSQWTQAVDYCSPEVQEQARQYPSAEAFFRAVVSLEDIMKRASAQDYAPKYNPNAGRGGTWPMPALAFKVAELEKAPQHCYTTMQEFSSSNPWRLGTSRAGRFPAVPDLSRPARTQSRSSRGKPPSYSTSGICATSASLPGRGATRCSSGAVSMSRRPTRIGASSFTAPGRRPSKPSRRRAEGAAGSSRRTSSRSRWSQRNPQVALGGERGRRDDAWAETLWPVVILSITLFRAYYPFPVTRLPLTSDRRGLPAHGLLRGDSPRRGRVRIARQFTAGSARRRATRKSRTDN
jgi:hypothetical protein